MRKVIISAALTGGKAKEPGGIPRPFTPDEIAKEVVECAKAGAAICHIHAHDEAGKGTHDLDVWKAIDKACLAAIKEAGVDVILNYTTSYGTGEQRYAQLFACHPEIASYDVGTLNWTGDGVFMNTPKFLEELGKACIESHVKPEIEIFDAHMIKWAERFRDRGILKDPLHFQLVMNTYGGVDGTVENLTFLKSLLPKGSTYSVTGIGKTSVPMMLAAIAMGADGIRVGMEDNEMMDKGVPATNLLQVERAVNILRLANCEPATAAEAREILSLPY